MGCSHSRHKNKSKHELACCQKACFGVQEWVEPCAQPVHATRGLARFKLLGMQGQGGSGVVHAAQCLDTGRNVAIKLVKRPSSRYEVQKLLMEVTVQAHMAARSQHVVPLHEVVLTPEHIGCVMELMPGGNAQSFIKSRMDCKGVHTRILLLVNEHEASFMFRQLVSAVRTCHQNRVAHRDLKPRNVVLDLHDPCTVMLADFGSADVWGPDGSDGHTVKGTQAYLSPEQLIITEEELESAGFDLTKADVWGLGVFLLMLLTGRLPFSDAPFYEAELRPRRQLMRLYTSGATWRQTPLLEKASHMLTPELVDLLDQLLQVDPKLRPDVDTIFAHPWVTQSLPTKFRDAWELLRCDQWWLEQKLAALPGGATPQLRTRNLLAAVSGHAPKGTPLTPPSTQLRCKCHKYTNATPVQRLELLQNLLIMATKPSPASVSSSLAVSDKDNTSSVNTAKDALTQTPATDTPATPCAASSPRGPAPSANAAASRFKHSSAIAAAAAACDPTKGILHGKRVSCSAVSMTAFSVSGCTSSPAGKPRSKQSPVTKEELLSVIAHIPQTRLPDLEALPMRGAAPVMLDLPHLTDPKLSESPRSLSARDRIRAILFGEASTDTCSTVCNLEKMSCMVQGIFEHTQDDLHTRSLSFGFASEQMHLLQPLLGG